MNSPVGLSVISGKILSGVDLIVDIMHTFPLTLQFCLGESIESRLYSLI